MAQFGGISGVAQGIRIRILLRPTAMSTTNATRGSLYPEDLFGEFLFTSVYPCSLSTKLNNTNLVFHGSYTLAYGPQSCMDNNYDDNYDNDEGVNVYVCVCVLSRGTTGQYPFPSTLNKAGMCEKARV